MANEYAVNQADLTAVADAIRSKGGASDALTFPGGFVDAVAAIQAGGDGSSQLEDLLSCNITSYESDRTEGIALARAFQHCKYLKTVKMNNVKDVSGRNPAGGYAGYLFANCTALEEIQFNNMITISSMAQFEGCTSLKRVVFPVLKNANVNNGHFSKCTALKYFEFASPTKGGVNQNFWLNCSSLVALVIRAVDGVWALGNVNSLTGTPIASGTGFVYVPGALLDEYKAATNWTTYENQFRALEDYTVDGTVTGELDESKVNAT